MKNKVLLVDDSKENILILMSILMESDNNFEIYSTSRPNEAIALVKQYKPDLIITDWDMPIMNGIELIKLIRTEKLFQNIPIIMASGVMTDIKDLKVAMEAGATDFVKKPFETIEIIARVNSALNLANLNKQLIQEKENQSIESTLMLIRRTKLQYQTLQELSRLVPYLSNQPEALEIVSSLKRLIDFNVKAENEKQFDISFKSAHQNFYENLLHYSPELSPSELRLCAYLRLGLNTKDIASLLFISPDSVKVFRSRIRKKLNLDSETNLQLFLSKF